MCYNVLVGKIGTIFVWVNESHILGSEVNNVGFKAARSFYKCSEIWDIL